MPGKTQAQTDAVLNVLRGTNITAPANVYAGLFSTNPANDASAGTELTGAGGYARQAVTFGAPATDTGNIRKISNTGPIAGSTTGASSGVGEIFLNRTLAGSTLGQSSGAGTVIKTSGMAGVATSASSGLGNLRAQDALAGAAAGTSSAAGSLSQIHSVGGVSAGTSLGTATLALLRALGGITTGTSGGIGDLTIVSGAQVDSLLAGKANAGHTHGISLYTGTWATRPTSTSWREQRELISKRSNPCPKGGGLPIRFTSALICFPLCRVFVYFLLVSFCADKVIDEATSFATPTKSSTRDERLDRLNTTAVSRMGE